LHIFVLSIETAFPNANIQFDKDRTLHWSVEGAQVTIDPGYSFHGGMDRCQPRFGVLQFVCFAEPLQGSNLAV